MEAQVAEYQYEPVTEKDLVNAVYRLAVMGSTHPQLVQKQVAARVRLAACIIAHDDAPEPLKAYTGTAVANASAEYAQALADLIRGEQEDT